MTTRGAAGRCPPTTWLCPWLLLVFLLVSRSIAEEISEHCRHMIGNGHLQALQRLIDSQMETSCHIAFEFADEEQLKDPVCYLKKAFLLVEDIMEDTMRFRDETPNAKAIDQLQALSVRLKNCFTKDYEKQDKACVRTFNETPLQLMEKIKNVFNETKNLLEEDWKIFSKNCSDSFAKCSSPGVVTKPDCNCLYPKATPSSDLASVSPHQPLAPSKPVSKADLTWAEAEGTEGRTLLPNEQPLHTVDPGSAKHRPPRSTCQSLASLETSSLKDSPIGGSPQPHPSAGAPSSGVEDILESALDTKWALEEASGEASEGPVPQGAEFSPSRPEGGSIQARQAISNLFLASSRLPTREDQQPPMPKVDLVRSTGQIKNDTAEKTDHSSLLPTEGEELGSTQTSSLRPHSSRAALSAQPQLPRSHSWGIVLPLGELEGKRITRNRRSPAELEGERASEGAARPPAPFNSVPLTDTGHERQPEETFSPQLPGFVFHLLVPSIILVLLAIGGLLFYRRRWRSHQAPQTVDSLMRHPEGSSLTQDEDRQVELPV